MASFSARCTIPNSRPRMKSTLRQAWTRNIPSTSTPVQCMYVCLSYTWSDGIRDRLILIDDKVFMVRRNLWEFLQAARERIHHDVGLARPAQLNFRGRCKTREVIRNTEVIRNPLIWIDAISIDQDSVLEKNHQVQQMGTIYARARMVMIWLGKDEAIKVFLRGLFLHRHTLEVESAGKTKCGRNMHRSSTGIVHG